MRNYGEQDGLARGAVTALTEDRGGTIWAVEAAHLMERAMEIVIRERRTLTPDLGGTASTSRIGSAVAAAVNDV